MCFVTHFPYKINRVVAFEAFFLEKNIHGSLKSIINNLTLIALHLLYFTLLYLVFFFL